jgi:hydroxylamine reductase (hybrid-cluster protein)
MSDSGTETSDLLWALEKISAKKKAKSPSSKVEVFQFPKAPAPVMPAVLPSMEDKKKELGTKKKSEIDLCNNGCTAPFGFIGKDLRNWIRKGENAHAPVQTLDMESMADMTANEEKIRLAFEAAQLKKDAEDLENIVNPKEKKPAAEGEESEDGDEESEDEGSEEEGDLDDEGSDDEGL